MDAVDKSAALLRAAFEKMELALADRPWLAGSTYSLADIAAAPVIDRIERLGLTGVWKDLTLVEGWIERLTSREAYARAGPRMSFGCRHRKTRQPTASPSC